MFTFPNLLSLLRFPLALLFIKENLVVRALTIALAAATDFFDGYMARKYKSTSRFGTVLDPVADKFFVVIALGIFLIDEKISLPEVCAMLCRDFSVIIFGLYLLGTNNFGKYHFRSIWCGKISTTLQFMVLFALTFNVSLPPYIYGIFIILGLAALVELYLSDRSFIPLELKNRSKKKL